MLIDGLTNAGAMPSLELTMRFAAQRQRLVAHNLANIDTPDFMQQDVSTSDFQRTLSQAIDARRGRNGGRFGAMPWAASSELRPDSRGEMRLVPQTSIGGPLAHDRNNRDLERTLQDLAESAGAFKAAASLYASQRSVLRDAIAERA